MKFRLDETDYTSSLKSAIDSYVRSQGLNVPEAYTPNSSRQSSKKIDKSHFFDLIKRLTEFSILVLEIKITHDGRKLISFDATQRKINAAFREVGIPIDYCYNVTQDYSDHNEPIYTLEKSNTADPDRISDENGNLIDCSNHKALKILVDELLKSSSSIGENVTALFAKGALDKIRDLNTKALFFCRLRNDFKILFVSDLLEIYREYESFVNLGAGIDFERSSKAEIVAHLNEAKQRWLTSIQLSKEEEQSHIDETESHEENIRSTSQRRLRR
jgi:hypothetical protein